MSAVGRSETGTSIVRPDPAQLDPPNSPPLQPLPAWAASQDDVVLLERAAEQIADPRASGSPAAPSALLLGQARESRSDGSGTDRTSTDRAPSGAARALRTITWIVLLAAAAAGTGWAALKYSSLGATSSGPVAMTHRVVRGDLPISVTEDGSVESASNIDIRCLVAGGGTIKEIIPDGTFVTQGQRIVEIDSAVIDESILQQKIVFEKARAVRDQAKNDLEAAKITLREYVEGTYIKDRQAVDSQITIAEEGQRSAQNMLLYTERMFRKGYVTNLQLESQQFAVKRSGLELETAKTAKRVLEEFTFAKMKNDLETMVSTATAKASSEDAAFALEESKLKRLEMQKLNCIITAPQSGMVVYANEGGSGRGSNNQPKIEEGAQVRESQVILRVPDLTQMQVKATVHESRVERLRPDMLASIEVQKKSYTGHVTAVANQPEPPSWMSSNIKKYAAIVRIDGMQKDLKPGMTAKVTILIAELKNVLTVPVQCIVQQGGKFYCWRAIGTDEVKTEVVLGLSDDRNVEITSGLSAGDVVLQNPPEKSGGEFTRPSDPKQFGDGPRGTGPADAGGVAAKNGPAAGGTARGPGAGSRVPDFATLDKNADGKLSVDELPEMMQGRIGQIDTNGDGAISAAEYAARPRRPPGAGGPGGPGGGGPGGGNQ